MCTLSFQYVAEDAEEFTNSNAWQKKLTGEVTAVTIVTNWRANARGGFRK